MIPELSLFYCHFVFDIVLSFAMLLNMIIMFLSTTDFVWFFVKYHNFAFYIVWPVYMIGSMRAIFVLIIEVDRVFATYFPITFYKYRKMVSTTHITIVVLSYAFVDAAVMFGYCGEVINVPPGCISIICAFGTCYYNYWKMLERVLYLVIIGFSIMLSLKLFVWNKIKKQKISNDLKRANRLALIDTFTIVVFCLFPPMIASYFPDFYSYLGPVNTFFKTMGFIVEGYLVGQNLKRKYADKSRKSPVVSAAGVSGSVRNTK